MAKDDVFKSDAEQLRAIARQYMAKNKDGFAKPFIEDTLKSLLQSQNDLSKDAQVVTVEYQVNGKTIKQRQIARLNADGSYTLRSAKDDISFINSQEKIKKAFAKNKKQNELLCSLFATKRANKNVLMLDGNYLSLTNFEATDYHKDDFAITSDFTAATVFLSEKQAKQIRDKFNDAAEGLMHYGQSLVTVCTFSPTTYAEAFYKTKNEKKKHGNA